MSLKQECDGPQCKNQTHVGDPIWIKVMPPQIKAYGHLTDDKHYCSWKCVHAHSYLLISGDNGK